MVGRRRGASLVAALVLAAEAAQATSALQARIDAARPGSVLRLDGRTWRGAIRVDRQLTLEGAGGAIDGGGRGTVVVVDAPGVVLDGVKVTGSGHDLGAPDACVYLTPAAKGTILRGLHLERCAFGVWVHETRNVQIRDSVVVGSLEGNRSERGNGIHLFNALDLVVEGNHITGGRDGIYVSATEKSLIRGNRMEKTRYGVHYMFSYDNEVSGNLAIDNTNGYALMESHNITARENLARGNAERGILFRDVQYCSIERNHVEGNGEGLFFYSSTENTIRDNSVVGNEVGARIWAGSVRNVISGNRFIGNRTQIFYVASSDLVLGEGQPGNYWSDYLGWDQDGDGLGDRPYRIDSFTTKLAYRYPIAALLLRSPALELLAHLEERLPLLRVPTVVDNGPLVRAEAQR